MKCTKKKKKPYTIEATKRKMLLPSHGDQDFPARRWYWRNTREQTAFQDTQYSPWRWQLIFIGKLRVSGIFYKTHLCLYLWTHFQRALAEEEPSWMWAAPPRSWESQTKCKRKQRNPNERQHSSFSGLAVSTTQPSMLCSHGHAFPITMDHILSNHDNRLLFPEVDSIFGHRNKTSNQCANPQKMFNRSLSVRCPQAPGWWGAGIRQTALKIQRLLTGYLTRESHFGKSEFWFPDRIVSYSKSTA